MFPILAMLFILIPALEIYLLFSIGGMIGGLNTFLIIILTGVMGAALARTQGLAVLFRIQGELGEGRLPTDQLLQGLLVFGGGLLLLTPGFLTDALGFSMVAPGSRALIAHFIKQHFQKALNSGNVHFYQFKGGGGAQGFHYHHSSSTSHHQQTETKEGAGVRQVGPDTFEVD